MRNSRFGLLAGISAVALAAGCAQVPHNNVLLFGTSTKFAVDVSADAAQGGVPNVTVGYKRQEGVWMPLTENTFTCQGATFLFSNCTTQSYQGSKYVGSASGIEKSKGGATSESDAYSVFASFGAKFSGEGGTGSSKTSGGIAQFFATGIAAQRLGANPQVVDALTIKSADAETVDMAKQALAASQEQIQQAQAELDKKLTAEQRDAIKNEVAAEMAKRRATLTDIWKCAEGGTPAKANAASIVDKAMESAKLEEDKNRLNRLKSNTSQTFWGDGFLGYQDDSFIALVSEAKSTVCPGGAK